MDAPLEERKKELLRFVIGLGLLSLFADFTYEGARSIVGAYLAEIGTNPIMAGLVAGFVTRLALSAQAVKWSNDRWA